MVNALTETRCLELIGDTIVNGQVTGDQLTFTTKNGLSIPAGNVRGVAAPNPIALETAFTPAGTIAATNLQAALAELGSDVTTLNSTKMNVSAVPKVRRGIVTVTNRALNTQVVSDFSTAFSTDFVGAIPAVVILPIMPIWSQTNEPNPSNLIAYCLHSVTLGGFKTVSMMNAYPDATQTLKFMYIAVQYSGGIVSPD